MNGEVSEEPSYEGSVLHLVIRREQTLDIIPETLAPSRKPLQRPGRTA
jgi:hypothetical protein